MGLSELRRNKAPTDREVVRLALLLVVGVFGIVPAGSLFLESLGLSLALSTVLLLTVVGGLFGVHSLRSQRLRLASLVATIVLSTLAANVPLPIGRYPGNVSHLMLFHLPLFATLWVLLSSGAYDRLSWSRIELLFAGFVGWAVLAAIFGAGPRTDTGLLFAAFMATVGVLLSAVYRSVATRAITLRQLLAVLAVTVAGQSVFALAQLLNQRGFGLTVLGEVHRYSEANTLTVPLLGDPFIGVFASGLTGGNGPLGQLLTIALPITIVLAITERSRASYPLYALAVLEAFLLRVTGKDAGRAAILLALLSLVGVFGLHRYLSGRRIDRGVVDRYRTRLTGYALLGAAIVLLTLLPSEGTTTNAGETEAVDAARTPVANGSGDAVAARRTATSTPAGSGAHGSGFDPSTVSVPFFDTGSLGIRLEQYVAGVHVTLRHPIFGIGGANYPYVAPEYGLPKLLQGNLFPLHSVFIALAAETGVPGLLLYVGALGVAAWAAIELLSTELSPLAIGAIAAMVGWAAVAFWTVTVRYTMVVPIWILAGAVVGASHRRKTAADT